MIPAEAAAIIPAAGYSRRMGRFKPLLPVGGRPLIAWSIELFHGAGIADIHVVVGHRRDKLLPVLEAAGVDIVVNTDFARGMFSSVKAGIRRLGAACRAFFVLPADIPLVRPATIHCLLQGFDETINTVAFPCFSHRRGHPPLIARHLAPPILASAEDGGLRAALARFENAALDVPVFDRHIHHDADSPDDYEALKSAWQRRDIPDAAECRALLAGAGSAGEPLRRHVEAVAGVAAKLTASLRQAGAALDPDLIRAAALLHDLAKGAPDHARAGAERLRRMGFAAVAEIVAQHHDLIITGQGPIRAAEVVYLADKLVAADRPADLDQRFGHAMARYGASADARTNIRRRWDQARTVQARIEARVGRTIDQIVGDGKEAPPEGKPET